MVIKMERRGQFVVGFVPGGSVGGVLGKTRFSSRRFTCQRVAPRRSERCAVRMNHIWESRDQRKTENGLLKTVQFALFSVAVGCGVLFSPRPAECRTETLAVTPKEKTSDSDLMSMIGIGGAVIGALFLKKQVDEYRENKEVEKRKKEQQELFQQGRAPLTDLRDIEQRMKTEQAMTELNADTDTVDDDSLMSDLRKRMQKLAADKDDGEDGEDDSKRPGMDGRRDRNARGNTGSATLEPPSGSGTPGRRPRRPIERPQRRPNPPGRRNREDPEARGGTVPREGEPVADGSDNVSKENLDMLRRMWEISGEGDDKKSDKP